MFRHKHFDYLLLWLNKGFFFHAIFLKVAETVFHVSHLQLFMHHDSDTGVHPPGGAIDLKI